MDIHSVKSWYPYHYFILHPYDIFDIKYPFPENKTATKILVNIPFNLRVSPFFSFFFNQIYPYPEGMKNKFMPCQHWWLLILLVTTPLGFRPERLVITTTSSWLWIAAVKWDQEHNTNVRCSKCSKIGLFLVWRETWRNGFWLIDVKVNRGKSLWVLCVKA